MSVTESEKSEIFRRLEESEKRDFNSIYQKAREERRKPSDNNGNSNKTIGGVFAGILVILAVIGGMAAIIRPLQQQIDMMADRISKNENHSAEDGHPIHHTATLSAFKKRMERIEDRIESQIHNLDEKLQVEIEKVESDNVLRSERVQARFKKLEAWQDWWHKNIPRLDGSQDEKINNLEKQKYDKIVCSSVGQVEVLDERLESKTEQIEKRADRLDERMDILDKRFTDFKVFQQQANWFDGQMSKDRGAKTAG